ncbi:hypothetical protein V3C99_018646 [Haemonchus contortus]
MGTPLRSSRKCASSQDSGDNVTKVQVCVRLAPPTVGAEPLHKLISQSQLFGEFPENSQATAVLDTIYGQQRIEVGPDGPQHKNVSVSVGGRSFTLREDQVAALEIGEHRLPILAIQAAFGTGKTVLGALIAGRTFSKFQERVIATTSTNTEVAQSTDTLLRLDEYRNIDILRYVSDSVLIEGAPQTPIDLHTILKRLPVDYADKLSEEALQTCRKYKRAVNYPKELHISDLTKDAVRIMFEVRPPAVVCITTAALLNSISADGIFCGWFDSFTTLVGDEASRIPDPALVALATHLPRIRHIYIGHRRQLEPLARCPRSSNPARFGAQSVMNVLLERGVPVAPPTTTFRAHPLLNELPNLVFYDHYLVNGTQAEERQLFLSSVRCPNPRLPFLFVDVPGKSTKSLSGSHSNSAEAEVCRQIVTSLLRKNVPPGSIAIISYHLLQGAIPGLSALC